MGGPGLPAGARVTSRGGLGVSWSAEEHKQVPACPMPAPMQCVGDQIASACAIYEKNSCRCTKCESVSWLAPWGAAWRQRKLNGSNL